MRYSHGLLYGIQLTNIVIASKYKIFDKGKAIKWSEQIKGDILNSWGIVMKFDTCELKHVA